MNPLHRRIEALEQRSSPDGELFFICRTFVSPGCLNPPIRTATMGGESFIRDSDETEADFIARLHRVAESRRKPGQFAAQAVLAS